MKVPKVHVLSVSLLLCFVLPAFGAQKTVPSLKARSVKAVFEALEKGDFEKAAEALKQGVSMKSVNDLLAGLIALEAGRCSEARTFFKRLVGKDDQPFSPFPDLWDAEAAIRLGKGSSVRARLFRIFSKYRLYRRVSDHALHLLVMQESWGEVPDEPCGLVPEADLGYSLAIRLGVKPPPKMHQTRSRGQVRSSQYRRYFSYVRERLPHAPILTLAGGAKRPLDSSPRGHILVAFLSCNDSQTLDLIRDSLLPLAYRSEPGRRLYVCLILYAPNHSLYKKTAAAIRSFDSCLLYTSPSPRD